MVLFFTAEVLVPNIINRDMAIACQIFALSAQERAQEVAGKAVQDELDNLIARLLNGKWPPLMTLRQTPIDIDYGSLEFAAYADPTLILGIFDENLHKLFVLPKDAPTAQADEHGFILLNLTEEPVDQTESLVRGVAVLPVGEHAWSDYAHHIPPQYVAQLLQLMR